MKKLYIILFAAVGLLSSCKKGEDNVSKTVVVSYPTITLKGQSVVNLAIGASYTEAGATLTDDISGANSDLPPSSNNVNTATAGLYLVNYSAANANGFETAASRVVTVTSVVDPVDYSGNYLRAATGQTLVITKISNGVYKLTNPGGAAGASDVVIYMVETAPGTFIAPDQPSSVGTFALSDIAYNGNAFTWIAENAGYGTSMRTFVKQ